MATHRRYRCVVAIFSVVGLAVFLIAGWSATALRTLLEKVNTIRFEQSFTAQPHERLVVEKEFDGFASTTEANLYSIYPAKGYESVFTSGIESPAYNSSAGERHRAFDQDLPLPVQVIEQYMKWHSVDALRREPYNRKFAIGMYQCPHAAGAMVLHLRVRVFLSSYVFLSLHTEQKLFILLSAMCDQWNI